MMRDKKMNDICFYQQFGYTQYDIAEMVGCSQATVSRVLMLKKFAEENRRGAFHQFCKDYRVGKDMRAWAIEKFPPIRVKPRIHERRKA